MESVLNHSYEDDTTKNLENNEAIGGIVRLNSHDDDNNQKNLINIIQYKILSFYYHLNRKDNPKDLEYTGRELKELLRFLKRKKNDLESFYYLHFIKLLWIIIAETRDIENGKGNENLLI